MIKPDDEPQDDKGYTKFEELPEAEVMLWAPSLRCIGCTNTYEEYLDCMKKYTTDIANAVDDAIQGK